MTTTTNNIVTQENDSAQQENLLALLASQHYSYHIDYADTQGSNKDRRIFMGFDGIYERKRVSFNGNTLALVSKINKVPGLRTPTVGFEFINIVNRIPYRILRELISNFKAIYDRDKTESAAQIYRLKEIDPLFPGYQVGDYVCYFPKQKNTSANTNYKDDEDAVVKLPSKHTLVMEAHSHAGFGAFFSGGDNANETIPLMYCVIGNFSTPNNLSFKGRVKIETYDQEFTIEELFDIPESVTAPLNTIDLPEPSLQMLTNASVSTHALTSYMGTNWQQELREKYPHLYKSLDRQGETQNQSDYCGNWGGYTLNNPNAGYYDPSYYDQSYYDETYYNRFRSRKQQRSNKDRKKDLRMDLKWLATNLSDTEATQLYHMLSARFKSKTTKKNEQGECPI